MQLEDQRPPEEVERELRLLHVLQRVWTYAYSTKSDLAREFADEFAEGASRGYLTTLVAFGRQTYGRLWKLTAGGTVWLEANSERIANSEVENYGQSICQAGER